MLTYEEEIELFYSAAFPKGGDIDHLGADKVHKKLDRKEHMHKY